jgi:hypothetical protein
MGDAIPALRSPLAESPNPPLRRRSGSPAFHAPGRRLVTKRDAALGALKWRSPTNYAPRLVSGSYRERSLSRKRPLSPSTRPEENNRSLRPLSRPKRARTNSSAPPSCARLVHAPRAAATRSPTLTSSRSMSLAAKAATTSRSGGSPGSNTASRAISRRRVRAGSAVMTSSVSIRCSLQDVPHRHRRPDLTAACRRPLLPHQFISDRCQRRQPASADCIYDRQHRGGKFIRLLLQDLPPDDGLGAVGAVSIGTRGWGTTAYHTTWRREQGAPSAPLSPSVSWHGLQLCGPVKMPVFRVLTGMRQGRRSWGCGALFLRSVGSRCRSGGPR